VWLYLQGPRQTLFSLVEYQLRYRQVDWPGPISHDIRVLLSWLDSSQALMLGLLAAGGILFAWKGPWGQAIRAELYLCGWVSAAEIIYIANIHPNFSQYYLFAVPFLAVLACAGLYALGSNLLAPDRPFWPVFLLSVMVAFGFLKSRNDERGKVTWRDAEQVARQIAGLHPRGPILVDELIYFLLRYPVPSGNELSDSHKLDLPPAIMTRMHLVSKAELERRIRAGEYDVVESWANEAWKEENWIDDVGLPLVYRHQVTFGDATIFWEWAGKF
jgi:hypothetical protein